MKEKGITLLALIITIIIMLILATVSFGAINGGLFNYAGKAVNKAELYSIIEELEAKGIMKGKKNLNGTLSEVLGDDYSKYDSTFKVVEGELVYLGDDPKTVENLFELGLKESSIENASAVCAVLGHNFTPANYLKPKTCTRCGYTEGEKLVALAPHPDQQNSTDIGIGTDGELVNLDNWTYDTSLGKWTLTGYLGPYSESEGEIEGTIPQVINNTTVKAIKQVFNSTQLKTAPEIPVTVTNVQNIFSDCTNLEIFPENYAINNNIINTISMFSGCKKIERLPETFLLPNKLTNCSSMFYECTNLKSLPGNFTIPDGCSSMSNMFKNCNALEELPDNFTIPSTIRNMTASFQACKSFTALPDRFTIPDGVTNMYLTFYQCTNLKKLPENFTIPASVTNLGMAFRFCSNLEGTITIQGNPTTYNGMFEGTGKLGNGVTVYYTSACTNIEAIKATATSGAKVTFEEISLETETQ